MTSCTMTMVFCARKTISGLSMRGDPLTSERDDNATWVFDFESSHLDDETGSESIGSENLKDNELAS